MIAGAAVVAALRRNAVPGLLWLVAAAGAAAFLWALRQGGIERGIAQCRQEHKDAAEAARETRALAGRKVEVRSAQSVRAIERRFDAIEQEAASEPPPVAPGAASTDAPAAGACFDARAVRLWNDANAAVADAVAAAGADAAVPGAAAAGGAGRALDPRQPHPLDAPVRAVRADEGGSGALDREPEPAAVGITAAVAELAPSEETDR